MCDLSHCCGCGNAIKIENNKPERQAVCMIKEVPIEDIDICPLDEVTVSLDLRIYDVDPDFEPAFNRKR